MAAVLACGPEALLSHWSAAAHWDLLRPASGLIDVSVPSHRDASRPIVVHRASALHHDDRTRRDGIPVTSVSRTLLDLAAVAAPRLLSRAVNQADRARRLDRRAIAELLERSPRRKGSRALRAVIAAVDPATRRTRSELEAAFLALTRRHGLPRPVANEKLHGIEVDMHWPGTTLIVELDSYEYHRTPAEFERDRLREARLKTMGYEVLRIPDSWLAADPDAVAKTVRALLYGVTSGSIASSE